MTTKRLLLLVMLCAGCENMNNTCAIICGAEPIYYRSQAAPVCICPGGRVYVRHTNWEIAAEACK